MMYSHIRDVTMLKKGRRSDQTRKFRPSLEGLAAFLLLVVLTTQVLWMSHVVSYSSTCSCQGGKDSAHKNETRLSDSVAQQPPRVVAKTTRKTEHEEYIGPQRTFQPWPHDFPCFPAEHNWHTHYVQRRIPTREGFFYVKEMKTGSSTLSGVALRIAHRKAAQLLPANQTINVNTTNKLCKVRMDHMPAEYLEYKKRDRKRSFLWSVIRDPTRRAVSEFFHFEVSRKKVVPSDANFQRYFQHQSTHQDQYYLRDLTTRPFDPKNNYTRMVQEILEDYDFIGITERMDESLVVLQMLLDLDTADILYLPGKTSGAFDDGAFERTCHFIVPSYVSPGMKEYFASDAWKKVTRGDVLLFQAVNRSLDLTIDRLGRAEFEQKLSKFRAALRLAESKCAATAVYPCSPGGVKTRRTTCYWVDSGCGYPCLDEISKQL